MTRADVLVLGGPGTGKTHYAGQFLGRLRHDREGVLRLLPGGAENLSLFEEVLDCLEAGRAAGHTPAESWIGMRLQLETDNGHQFALEWPDYAGERLDSIINTRTITPEWRESIATAQAWMLFVRPGTLRLYEDLLRRPTGLPPKNATLDSQRIRGTDWDDRARYVELLQILLFVSGQSTYHRVTRPRLAVILSCWDEVESSEPPEQYLRLRLPLLHAFIRSTWADGSWSVWALSSLGRSLRTDTADLEFIQNGPEKHGYVIPPGTTERKPDLTAPVAWLLGV